jgi:hypothetical protein
VKNFYNTLQFGESSFFPWKSVWKVKAPSRIAFFTWTTVLGKILTIDNLRRQGLILVNWCCLCKKSEETVNNLLLHCEFTRELWHLVLFLFGVLWIMSGTIVELLQCWKTQGRRQSKEAIWKVIPSLLMWTICRERNRHLFEDCETNVLHLKASFLSSLLDWALTFVPNFSSNIVGFVNFLDFRSH